MQYSKYLTLSKCNFAFPMINFKADTIKSSLWFGSGTNKPPEGGNISPQDFMCFLEVDDKIIELLTVMSLREIAVILHKGGPASCWLHVEIIHFSLSHTQVQADAGWQRSGQLCWFFQGNNEWVCRFEQNEEQYFFVVQFVDVTSSS